MMRGKSPLSELIFRENQVEQLFVFLKRILNSFFRTQVIPKKKMFAVIDNHPLKILFKKPKSCSTLFSVKISSDGGDFPRIFETTLFLIILLFQNLPKRQLCAKGYPNWFRNGRENREQTNKQIFSFKQRYYVLTSVCLYYFQIEENSISFYLF